MSPCIPATRLTYVGAYGQEDLMAGLDLGGPGIKIRPLTGATASGGHGQFAWPTL
jgi:hypothetical protein